MRKIDYSKKTVPQLIKIAQKYFNAYIRKRDEGRRCINCGKTRPLQAGHFYPTGSYPGLRFNEDNVHGECLKCNYFDSQSHAYGYKSNLFIKIGPERFEKLQNAAAWYKRHGKKWDRFELIEIIEKYK